MATKRKLSPASRTTAPKSINLALQGGGAHGAYAWGVLDRLLEDERLTFEGITGTSAGSMNAVVLAYGLLTGGRSGARQALDAFWRDVSETGQWVNPVRALGTAASTWPIDLSDESYSASFEWFKGVTQLLSPYQLNPFNINPLRDVLMRHVDFDELRQCQITKLFLSATNVRTGKVRVFTTREIGADHVLASACLPMLFHAVKIDGDYFWDGGYMGNPSLFPLFYLTEARDVLIVHINPIERPAKRMPPTSANDIFDRINEVSFNSSLIKELRSVAFVQKLLDEDWLKPAHRHKLKYVLVHSIRADRALADLSAASKFASDWSFLLDLKARGRAEGERWLKQHYDDIGVRQTVNLRQEFLDSGAELQL
jgi:NTE family protein